MRTSNTAPNTRNASQWQDAIEVRRTTATTIPPTKNGPRKDRLDRLQTPIYLRTSLALGASRRPKATRRRSQQARNIIPRASHEGRSTKVAITAA